jgi:2-phosphosulfolactate phosphatase
MESHLEVLFSPAEFAVLPQENLSDIVCVVFDVLRATTTMMTALQNSATKIFPVREISEAVALARLHPNCLLAGERDGVRILATQTGTMDFDMGNSPQEFSVDRVQGREIIMTTTNGTRALQACRGAKFVLVGAFLNLSAVAAFILKRNASRVLIVCSGTFEEAAYEDTLAAGALCNLLWKDFQNLKIADSAQIARQIFLSANGDVEKAFAHSRNARRLLANPDLSGDVSFCAQRDIISIVAEMRDGIVQILSK